MIETASAVVFTTSTNVSAAARTPVAAARTKRRPAINARTARSDASILPPIRANLRRQSPNPYFLSMLRAPRLRRVLILYSMALDMVREAGLCARPFFMKLPGLRKTSDQQAFGDHASAAPYQSAPLADRVTSRITGETAPGETAPSGGHGSKTHLVPVLGNYVGGEWTAEAIEERKWLRSLARAARLESPS